ncbi:unnamed protein product [Camellia sinensis]
MILNFVLPIVMKIGEYLVAPVGCQFGYLFSCERNIKNLEKQVQKLEDKRFGVQKSVEEAETKTETIAPDVERWLKTVNELNKEGKKFLEVELKANDGCSNRRYPNLKLRYSLGDFSSVSYPAVAPSVGTTFAFTGGFKGFESRRLIMNGVMGALTDDSIYVIGICGMGGVGKTTMVKEVAKKAEEKKMFPQNPDLINIQGEIAKILGFELSGGNNLFARAGELGSRILMAGRILVILDDVWKRLGLNDIGIPCGDHYKGCKIVMTSRSEDVCIGMDADKNFKVGILREKEAWNLFKEMAGISNNGTSHPTDLQLTQMVVAKECGGLPIAIVTIGRALRCKKKPSWDSALEQLRKSMVKKSLKYAIGIELFEHIDNVRQARDRCVKMHDVIRDVAISIASGQHSFMVRCDRVLEDWPENVRLKNYVVISLKLDGMHGLPGNLEFPNLKLLQLDCNARLPRISYNLKKRMEEVKVHGLPGNLEFSNLNLLQLDCNARLPRISYDLNKRMEEVKVQETQDSFYQGMKELKVLSLSYMYSSLPASLGCLINLPTLLLFHCRLIDDDISVIGALENLEILSFAGSYIKELPKAIVGHLAHLKVLDLLGCVVERIYPGVLSSLLKLEELYVGTTFQRCCKVEESKEGAKAIIDELASLSNLVVLDIALINITFWPRGLVFEKVKKFNIVVGVTDFDYIPDPCYSLSNLLKLRVQNVSDIIEMRLNLLLKSTEILYVNSRTKGLKILCDLVDEDGFECLTKLSLRYLDDLEYLINTADGVPQSAFPVLE